MNIPVNNNGQATMANSQPVVIASDQTSIPVTVSGSTTISGTVTVVQPTSASLNCTEASAASILTSVQLIDDTVVSQSTALGSTKLSLVGGSVTTAAPTFTTGNINQLSLTTAGALRVDLGATSANSTAIKVDGSAVTQPISYATTGSGTATGAIRVEIANNGTGLVGLNAGTNAIGKLAANSGIDIGDVDVTSVIAGTGATNLGKAEDAGHTTGDTGVFALGVRNDAMSATTSNDADYSQISVTRNGRVLCIEATPDNMVRGATSVTGTSDTSVLAASGSASLKTYIKSVQIVNTGSTTSLITFKDGNAGSTLGYTIAPAGGGSNLVFEIPLVTSANTAFYFAAASASTTIYISAQGYYNP